MPRSTKQWCEHCQKHISQQCANEHWAFLFNPYTTARLPSGSTAASEAPGNYENTEYWNEPFNNEEAFLPEDNHLPNPAHLQNIRAWVEDGDEDEDLMDMDGWTTRELDDKDESDSEDEEEDFDWDGFVRRYRVSSRNLSPEDRLGAAFEQEASAATLAEYDLAICRAFAYKLTTHTTDRAFAKTPYAFPRHPSQLPLPKLDGIRSRVTALSSVVPRLFDCCPNSCCAYTGHHADLDTCPYCHEKRFRANGKPRKQFTYIPLIPRLQAFTRSTDMVEKMQYRAREHKHKAGHLNDIFDGTTYRKLRRRHVHINHTPLPHKYFEDERDCALGLSTDGFAPHKRRKKTAWPLIIFNYNLPPDIRFHVEHILSLGVIPGPKKPHDIDSFLWPLLKELSLLAGGVRAYDVLNNVIFSLRAYLIAVFGDIPAVSMLMHMKGHNAKSPCRMCSISGVAGPDSRTYYVPLNREWNVGDDDGNNIIQAYDPHSLPMHSAIILCPPKAQSTQDHLSAGLVTAVCTALVTRFDSRNITIRVVRKHFQSAHVEVWGCIRQVDSEEGETIRASHVGGIASEDSRDATFVQYEAYVDLHARKKNHRRKMVLQQFYGQLERIIVVSFSDPDACRVLRVSAGEEICLAAMRSCKLDNKQPLRDVDMYFYSSTGALDVIGIESIQCLMGRVKNRNKTGWVLLDRSGVLKRTLYIESDD
ncbi:hypothetical protein D9758_018018 [Tetrapyrgos nigripes]|uniref:Transposase family Tnp2 protein n=1 Tax=Tetrapyrgos nigripes TaxID=182062 RepID=A0A8H5C9L4_9AGAR|nr:hypothetical protein D9758_018018 [Tetrapyrgos nigripes]